MCEWRKRWSINSNFRGWFLRTQTITVHKFALVVSCCNVSQDEVAGKAVSSWPRPTTVTWCTRVTPCSITGAIEHTALLESAWHLMLRNIATGCSQVSLRQRLCSASRFYGQKPDCRTLASVFSYQPHRSMAVQSTAWTASSVLELGSF